MTQRTFPSIVLTGLLASLPVGLGACQPAASRAAPLSPPGSSPAVPAQAPASHRPELRGLWVDAFGPGLKTPAEIDRLVSDARALGVNVLFAQVGRRGDCYCTLAAMPRTGDPAVPAGFDPLADLIVKAHAQGIQVHAWIITTAIWNSATPPADPAHAFNAHGPGATGRDAWLMVKRDGTLRSGADWLLDPGHPDAAAYIRNMYVSVVQHYDVDGIQFDRVRYPDDNPTPGVNAWGYNPTALERFRAETNRMDTPEPADAQWAAWRRQQVTNLVRETALAVKAVRPDVSVNAATITYGAGPVDEAGFALTRTNQEVLQDWLTWVREGYLDVNVMMNYKRDHVPAQAGWFAAWNAFAASLRAANPGTAQVSGSAIYLNTPDGSRNQAAATLAAGLDGWAGYSYRTPDSAVNDGKRTQEPAWAELTAKLAGPGGPLEHRARWPRPSPGHLHALSGQVTSASGPLGGRTVTLLDAQGQVVASTQTDGAGRYGFMRFPFGPVRVRVAGVTSRPVTPLPRFVTRVPALEVP